MFSQGEPEKLKKMRYRIIDGVSQPAISRIWYFAVVLFFFTLVLIPTLFVLVEIPFRFADVEIYIISNPEKLQTILEALYYSVSVAIIITVIDLIFGLPIAWVLVRRDFRGKSVLNAIIELPLAVPTAGLGFSVALFWGVTPGVTDTPLFALSFIQDALPILVLFHFTTTFPLCVRSLAAILEEIDVTLEIAARTCGASRFTAARTVTFPLFRSGVATAMVLTLAKSLSDTGGVTTLLATVGSLKRTGTVLTGDWKHTYQDAINAGQNPEPYLFPGMLFLSVLMILVSLVLVFVAKLMARNAKLPFNRVFPTFERRVSEGSVPKTRSILSFGFLVIFVLIPSFFIGIYLFQGFTVEKLLGGDWTTFFQSILFSVIVASAATIINVFLGVPMAILIARKKNRLTRLLDILVDIPYVVPSTALGFSVGLFWTTQRIFPVFTLFFVVMAHMSMTFPYIVRNTIGGLQELDTEHENAARSLGARPIQVFRNITLPVIKFSIIAGAIMSFTRSIGETGASLAVSPDAITAPVFIVNLIKAATPDYFFAALTTIILILISSGLIFFLRSRVVKKQRS